MDIGIYGELRYLFTYRKPYGRMMHVTRKDGTIFQMENIFSLDSTTGEIRLATDDPRIDNSIASITVEVAVRDHPDNPIFGQRAAQVSLSYSISSGLPDSPLNHWSFPANNQFLTECMNRYRIFDPKIPVKPFV